MVLRTTMLIGERRRAEQQENAGVHLYPAKAVRSRIQLNAERRPLHRRKRKAKRRVTKMKENWRKVNVGERFGMNSKAT